MQNLNAIKLIYSPLGRIEMAALELEDAINSVKLLKIIDINNQI